MYLLSIITIHYSEGSECAGVQQWASQQVDSQSWALTHNHAASQQSYLKRALSHDEPKQRMRDKYWRGLFNPDRIISQQETMVMQCIKIPEQTRSGGRSHQLKVKVRSPQSVSFQLLAVAGWTERLLLWRFAAEQRKGGKDATEARDDPAFQS